MGELNVSVASDKAYDLGIFNLDRQNFKRLDFLINTEEDFKTFLNQFWTGETRQFYTISAFRLHKIDSLHLSFDQFMKEFKKDEIAALEHLFQFPVKKSHLRILHNRFDDGELTLRILFDRHKQDPEYPLPRHIL